MSGKLRLTGSSSGYIELQAADTANNATLTIPNDGFGGGKILQLLSSDKTDTASTTANSDTDITGTDQSGSGSVWCVKITPSATSSKILVLADISIAGGGEARWNLYRDSTHIHKGDAATGRVPTTVGGWVGGTNPFWYGAFAMHKSYLDSPSSTSELTYKIMWYSYTNTAYLNRSGYDYSNSVNHQERTASSITVMEVGA